MAQAKPDLTTNGIWGSTGSITDPGAVKNKTGWVSEIPPSPVQNYYQNQVDKMLAHVNEQGIPVWDVLTDYPVDALQKGSDGEVYKSLQTPNINQDPTSAAAFWEIWTPGSGSSSLIALDSAVSITILSTVVTVVGSVNFASPVRNSTGLYTYVFSSAMANEEYIINGLGSRTGGGNEINVSLVEGTKTTTGFQLTVNGISSGNQQDPTVLDVMIGRIV